VVAEIDNGRGMWRQARSAAAIVVDSAPFNRPAGRRHQTMDGGPVAFVRTRRVQKRKVVLGQRDDRTVEVIAGLMPNRRSR
jgi:hypothetical protein